MPRKVFFSFHYDDVTRVNVVRNSDQITRQYQKAARFHDRSLWEEAKQGPLALKRMINGGLDGSSVTCVLIGQQTWQRPWVRYQILKSLGVATELSRSTFMMLVSIRGSGRTRSPRSSHHSSRRMHLRAYITPRSRRSGTFSRAVDSDRRRLRTPYWLPSGRRDAPDATTSADAREHTRGRWTATGAVSELSTGCPLGW